ncbi:MAG: hypothetical protein JWM59_1189 [Verrucomicrobiales bacterium]|nr:hypothetical protein [Verrucomicrobiales bacterium]
MTSLISPDDSATLWAVITCGAALAIWLEQTYKWAARLSAAVIALLIAMILSNTRIMPLEADVYNIVEKWLVPLAVPLLLARANVREILRSGRGPLIAVNLAAIGTLIGTAVAVTAMRPWIQSPEIEHSAGLMTASYVGGGVNFFAIKNSYSISESLTSPLLVADNFVMAGFFVMMLSIAASKWFRARYPHPHIKEAEKAAPEGQGASVVAEHTERKSVSVFDIAQAFGFAFIALALAFGAERGLKAAFGDISQAGTGFKMLAALCTNRFVLLTSISLILATVLAKPLKKVNGMDEFGSWMLMLFLFTLGLPADLWLVLTKTPLLFVFCTVIALFNVGFALAAGKLLKVNLEELLLAMNATLGGPPTAAAMAVSAGWSRLVLPGLLIGLYGYIVGTPLGIMVIEFFLRK